MSRTQKESSVFDDSLVAINVVTTPRNELSCDTPSLEPSAWKKKTCTRARTHTQLCLWGDPFGNNVWRAWGFERVSRSDLIYSVKHQMRAWSEALFLLHSYCEISHNVSQMLKPLLFVPSPAMFFYQVAFFHVVCFPKLLPVALGRGKGRLNLSKITCWGCVIQLWHLLSYSSHP